MKRRFLLLALLCSLNGVAQAHEFRVSVVEIRALMTERQFDVRFTPAIAKMTLSTSPECTLAHSLQNTPGRAQRARLSCSTLPATLHLKAPEGLGEGEVMLRYVMSEDARDVVAMQRVDEPIVVAQDVAALPESVRAPPAWDTAQLYLVLGIEHILLGFDHLLFVLGLLLLVQRGRVLVATITSFTVAHSITLALSSLGWVRLPAGPVEACIALSILLLAVELTHSPDRESLTMRRPWVVAFAFGLLHGFGFAGALSALGLPEGQQALALATFNVGVEVGQLMFVVVLVGLSRLVWRTRSRPQMVTTVCAYLLGSLAVVWMCDRVVGFWAS